MFRVSRISKSGLNRTVTLFSGSESPEELRERCYELEDVIERAEQSSSRLGDLGGTVIFSQSGAAGTVEARAHGDATIVGRNSHIMVT